MLLRTTLLLLHSLAMALDIDSRIPESSAVFLHQLEDCPTSTTGLFPEATIEIQVANLSFSGIIEYTKTTVSPGPTRPWTESSTIPPRPSSLSNQTFNSSGTIKSLWHDPQISMQIPSSLVFNHNPAPQTPTSMPSVTSSSSRVRLVWSGIIMVLLMAVVGMA